MSIDERLAQALHDVTRHEVFPGDKGYDKWLAQTVAALLAAPSLRGLRELVEAAEAWDDVMPERLVLNAANPSLKLAVAIRAFRGAISPEAPKP